jgi:hypothetical protein
MSSDSTPANEDPAELVRRVGRMEDEISDLRERIRRIERNIDSSSVPPDRGMSVEPAVPSGPKSKPIASPNRPVPQPLTGRGPGAFEGPPGYRHHKVHPTVRTPGSGESSKPAD